MTDAAGDSAGPRDAEERLFCELVGRNAGYYLRVRRQMAATGNTLVWNWSAFLFSAGWMMYRRMWGTAIAILFILMVFAAAYGRLYFSGSIVPESLPADGYRAASGFLELALLLGVPLFAGLFGNHFYIAHINARMKRLGGAGAS
jgi:hypothetical protein